LVWLGRKDNSRHSFTDIGLKMHIVHILNKYSVTASALDQIQYTLRDGIYDVSLVVGPSEMDSISNSEMSRLNIHVLKNNIFSISGFFELRRIIQKIDADVVHSHHAKSGFIASILSRSLNIKSIIEDGAKRNNYKILTRILFTLTEVLSNKVVFVSKSVKNSLSTLERWLIPNKKTVVIYYGVDVPDVSKQAQREFRDKFNLEDDSIVLSHTGRFIPVKNQDKIIRLFCKIKTNKMKLVIAGDGPLKTELTTLVDELKLKNQVIFCGMLKRNDVYTLLSISTYFIMLSKTEGHSVSLLEAMGYGCVPILSKIDSFTESVNKNCSVFVDDKYEHKSILENMLTIDPKSVKEYYELNYSSEKMMKEYNQVYQDMVLCIT
jgi:glycosyltransferase involved in cell wall biosynthesis